MGGQRGPDHAENPAAVQLLGVCAYLGARAHPAGPVTGHADLLPQPLASAAADQVAFEDAVAVLVDYSLAKRTPAGLQLHGWCKPPSATARAVPRPPGLHLGTVSAGG